MSRCGNIVRGVKFKFAANFSLIHHISSVSFIFTAVGATGIELEPNPSDWSGTRTADGHMQLNVNDKITCSARGNPPPTIM